MSRTANQFQDPAGVKSTYDWIINHAEEQEFAKRRNIQHGAPTGGVGLVRQQGDDSPMLLDVRGTILKRVQLVEFLEWFELCRTQSIYFHDFAGDSYEVVITDFDPTRQRTVKNPQGTTINPGHYWNYVMKMEVLRFIDGPYYEASITP